MGMRLQLSKLSVVITVDTTLSGTWSTSFLKSAIRVKGSPGSSSNSWVEPGLPGGQSDALYYHSPTSALLRCNTRRKAIRKSQVCVEEEGCIVEKQGCYSHYKLSRELCHWHWKREPILLWHLWPGLPMSSQPGGVGAGLAAFIYAVTKVKVILESIFPPRRPWPHPATLARLVK